MVKKKLRHLVEQRVGSVLAGKYTINRVLGVGGMGAVYEATHSFTDRRVAVKLLHGDFSKMTSVGQRFLREAKATAALDHPCILQVIDAGQDADGRLYLVFDKLDGETLAAILKREKVPVPDLIRIFANVLDALAVAHSNGIVHRDIKPGNVFICENRPFPERVKLIDFGIARRADHKIEEGLTQAGTILGTPKYMSPEVMLGEPVDPAADLWATCVMMYLAFTGSPPFVGKTTDDLVECIMRTQLASPEHLSPEVPSQVGWIVIRGLNVERTDRWPSALVMASKLREAAPFVEPPAKLPTQIAPMPELVPSPAAPLPEEDWVPTEAIEQKEDWRVALDEIKDEIADLKQEPVIPAPDPTPTPQRPSLWARTTSWLSRKKPGDET